MRKRFPPITLLCWAALAALPQAQAIGLGPVPGVVPLGQPLDMSIPVKLGPTESLTSQCVQAEVLMGDTPVAPGVVRLRLETRGEGALARMFVRLSTSSVVTEPLVTVNLTLGCPALLTRQIVAFADPPEMIAARAAATPPTPVALPVMAAAPGSPAAATALDGGARIDPDSNRGQSSAQPVQRRRPAAVVAQAGTEPAARAVNRTGAKANAKAPSQGVPPASKRALAKAAAPAAPKLATAEASAAPLLPNGARPRLSASIIAASVDLTPRLQLDTYDRGRVTAAAAAQTDTTLAKAEASAAAALAASDAVGALQGQRVEVLERDLKRAREEAANSRASNAALRGRLGEVEGVNQWLPALAGLSALGLGLAGWLAWRLRRVERERKLAWWNAQDASAVAAAEGMALPSARSQALEGQATAGPTLQDDAVLLATGQLPNPVVHAAAPTEETASGNARPADDLAAEEDEIVAGASSANIETLIDLEQQVEFFVLLGQEDSAIDLLADFLKSHGADAPLVHLRLLETYHRKGDTTAYEKARARMARLFGDQAPAWAEEWQAGRGLDEYPEVMNRVNDAWSTPWQAMSELEGVMFNAKGQPAMDLAAYRDALVLYSTLRDKEETPEGEPAASPPLVRQVAAPVAAASALAAACDEPEIDQALEWISTEMSSLSQKGQAAEPTLVLTPPTGRGEDLLTLDLPPLELIAPPPAEAQVFHSVPSAGGREAFALDLDLDLSDEAQDDREATASAGELSLVGPHG